jgi:hypothetical protein
VTERRPPRAAGPPNPPSNVCCVIGFDAPTLALGLCNRHWRRTRKYGSPVAAKRHSGMMVALASDARFERQVKKTPTCWLWAGATDGDGYGIFRGDVGGIEYKRAHRFFWAFHTGEVLPRGMMICHRCENPRCVNPDRLFPGTAADNNLDKIRKGRAKAAFGSAVAGARPTAAQVKRILGDPRPYAQIAADYSVAASTIGSIKQKVSWASV